jgi:serine/threonine protein phosphatase 1
VPEDVVVYAVGDIHGEAALLGRLIDAIAADAGGPDEAGRKVIVFLGDYIDRGPASAAVLSRLVSRPLAGFEHHFLRGNHEQVFLDFLTDPNGARDWLEFGGIATADSYGAEGIGRLSEPGGVEALAEELHRRLPEAHRDFLRSLRSSVELGDYYFAHAGIRPQVSLDNQEPRDLIWIREPFLSWRRPHPKVIVHGHTIETGPVLGGVRIGIDTGAYATGLLTALVLRRTEQRILQVNR